MNNYFFAKRNKTGSVLVSVLMTAALISILLSMSISVSKLAKDKSKNVVVASDINQLKAALEMYYEDNASYPESGNENLVSALQDKYAKIPVEKGRILDPWGKPYLYQRLLDDKGLQKYIIKAQGGLNLLPIQDITGLKPGCSSDIPVEEPDDPAPPVPPAPPVVYKGKIKAVPNENFVYLLVYDMDQSLEAFNLWRSLGDDLKYYRKDYVEYTYHGYENNLEIIDKRVIPNSEHFYKSELFFDIFSDESFYTEAVSVIPKQGDTDQLEHAHDILLNDNRIDFDSGEKLAKNIDDHEIEIMWGFWPPSTLPDGTGVQALAFYVPPIYNSLGKLVSEDRIVFNIDAVKDWSDEELAVILSHEGTHALWQYDQPPLPSNVKQSSRSYNSIDEEYNAFKNQAEVWSSIRSKLGENGSFDQWVSRMAMGEEWAKLYVAYLYPELPAY
ncbi:type II secretion system protein GspG [bacterium]|nr:type II secretion system protein GspG [bacterium]